MVDIGDQGGAIHFSPGGKTQLCRDLVARKADCSGQSEREQMVGCVRADDLLDCNDPGKASTDQDREDDGQTRKPFPALRTKDERNS